MTSLKVVVDHQNYNGPIVGYSPAVSEGLLAWHFPKDSAAQTVRNFARGANDASIIGAPNYTSGYMRAQSGSDYFMTDDTDPSDFTVIAVGRWPSPVVSATYDQTPQMCGNAVLGSSGFYLGYLPTQTGDRLAFGRVLSDGSMPILKSSETLFDASQFNFAAATSVSSGEQRLYNKTTGNDYTETRSLEAVNGGKITVGGVEDSYGGEGDVAFYAFYDRVLSAEEIDQVYQQVKAYLAARNGISV